MSLIDIRPPLRTLTLWQPFASLMFTDPPRKGFETRSWPLPSWALNREIAIHAGAKRIPRDTYGEALHELCMDEFGCGYNETVPFGAVLGTVRFDGCWAIGAWDCPLVDADEKAAGDWREGRFAWRAEVEQRFGRGFPARGRQKWWDWQQPPQKSPVSSAQPDTPNAAEGNAS